MRILRTRDDPTAIKHGPRTYQNTATHWWDGSQIYGSDPTFARAIRSGEDGLLRITAEGRPIFCS